MSIRNLVVIPIETSIDKSMVEETMEDTEAHEYILQDGHKIEEESIQAPEVEDSKKESPTIKVASYHHPHHPTRQQLSRHGCGHQQAYYEPCWNQNGNQYGGTQKTQSKAW